MEQADYLHTGRGSVAASADRISLKHLCNIYLDHQHSRVRAGEIKLRQVYGQTSLLRVFAQHLGSNLAVSDLSTIDLQRYRTHLINRGLSASRINNHIGAFKALFHWAHENEIISSLPNLKAIKKLPRTHRPKPTFSTEDIEKLLQEANGVTRAMIWFGLNCGFGCTDCAELLWDNVDLKAARIVFPRTKTGVNRCLPLWKETVDALKDLPRINERVFNTRSGDRVVRVVERTDLGVDYSITHSCHDPDENGLACGRCDSCILRKKGFAEAGVTDPTSYSHNSD